MTYWPLFMIQKAVMVSFSCVLVMIVGAIRKEIGMSYWPLMMLEAVVMASFAFVLLIVVGAI